MNNYSKDEAKKLILDNSTPKYLRIALLYEFMNWADKDSLDVLMKVAKKDQCELVRHEAVFALGEVGTDVIVINFLKDLCKNDESIVVKHECLVVLGIIGFKDDINFLEKYLDDKLFEVKCSATIGIDRINQTEDFENLVLKDIDTHIKRLFDYNKSTQNDRVQILFQLMKLANSNENVLNAIEKCLNEDSCRVVRHEAGFVLGEIGSLKAVEIMGKALERESTNIVRHELLFALGTSGKQEALEYIEKYLENESYVVNESAKIAKDRILKLDKPYNGLSQFEKK